MSHETQRKALGLSTVTNLRALVRSLRVVTSLGSSQIPHTNTAPAGKVMALSEPLISAVEDLLLQDGWRDLVTEDRQLWREQRYGKLLPEESGEEGVPCP